MGGGGLGGNGESATTDLFLWDDVYNLGEVRGADCAI